MDHPSKRLGTALEFAQLVVRRKFPQGGSVPLESIRAREWSSFEPHPIRIIAARFIQVDSWQVPRYFALQMGEFIQGLLAHITHHQRVYMVTGARRAC